MELVLVETCLRSGSRVGVRMERACGLSHITKHSESASDSTFDSASKPELAEAPNRNIGKPQTNVEFRYDKCHAEAL